jgi:hypothetical protein
MEYIKGITFQPFGRRGTLAEPEARESLRLLRERTAATHIILAPSGVQQTPQSEQIEFGGPGTFSDGELCTAIGFAQSLGLKVILKPTVNCANGVWRAFINFFDNEVPCEPKWSRWFESHTRFMRHYAEIAQRTGCVMFITGCEMVMAQRREAEWRELVARVREVYGGPVSYNTDKYQEDQVGWWDCVDVISSSGYYPLGAWEEQLDRIEGVVGRYGKPFFFAEAGCMSVQGAARVPNDWTVRGAVDADEQARWYADAFQHASRRPWVRGFGLWDWPAHLPPAETAARDGGYGFYEKPAEALIRRFYESV